MATASGTARYMRRFPKNCTHKLAGFNVSPFGFGCYRVDHSNEAYKESMVAAIRGGCNVLDTSSNYMYGLSELLVNNVVNDMIDNGEISRDEVVVVTKAGYIQGPDMDMAQEFEASGKPFTDVTKVQPGFWHCISKDFLRHQVEASSRRLGLNPDILLLHNPEYFLTTHMRQNSGAIAPSAAIEGEYYSRLQRAFECLEELVSDGSIQAYGVSSNVDGCNWSVSGVKNEYELTSVSKLAQIAEEVAGAENNFKALQVPLNLVEAGVALPDADTGVGNNSNNASSSSNSSSSSSSSSGGGGGGGHQKQKQQSTLQRAAELGIDVMVNRPLNAIPPAGVWTGGDWSRETEFLVLKDTTPMRPIQGLLKAACRDHLLGWENDKVEAGLPYRMDLSAMALWVAASTPGVSNVLCGARQQAYVHELLDVMALPKIPEDRTRKILDQVVRAIVEITPTSYASDSAHSPTGRGRGPYRPPQH